jgi:hypothetical protein
MVLVRVGPTKMDCFLPKLIVSASSSGSSRWPPIGGSSFSVQASARPHYRRRFFDVQSLAMISTRARPASSPTTS